LSKERITHYIRTNIRWYVLYSTGITMIQTKAEETREAKIRSEIEELTRQIIQVETQIEDKQKEINRLPTNKLKYLKDMVNERVTLEWKRDYLVWQRNDKINLLNQVS